MSGTATTSDLGLPDVPIIVNTEVPAIWVRRRRRGERRETEGELEGLVHIGVWGLEL